MFFFFFDKFLISKASINVDCTIMPLRSLPDIVHSAVMVLMQLLHPCLLAERSALRTCGHLLRFGEQLSTSGDETMPPREYRCWSQGFINYLTSSASQQFPSCACLTLIRGGNPSRISVDISEAQKMIAAVCVRSCCWNAIFPILSIPNRWTPGSERTWPAPPSSLSSSASSRLWWCRGESTGAGWNIPSLAAENFSH